MKTYTEKEIRDFIVNEVDELANIDAWIEYNMEAGYKPDEAKATGTVQAMIASVVMLKLGQHLNDFLKEKVNENI